jgi:hypothetical protein
MTDQKELSSALFKHAAYSAPVLPHRNGDIVVKTRAKAPVDHDDVTEITIDPTITDNEMNSILRIVNELKDKHDTLDLAVSLQTVSGNIHVTLQRSNRNTRYKFRFRRALFFITGLLLGWLMALMFILSRDI